MGQSATHACVGQETDATLTIHSSSEGTLHACLIARITITDYTYVAFTGQKHPSNNIPSSLMPRAKGATAE
jgi:hypothetical protein